MDATAVFSHWEPRPATAARVPRDQRQTVLSGAFRGGRTLAENGAHISSHDLPDGIASAGIRVGLSGTIAPGGAGNTMVGTKASAGRNPAWGFHADEARFEAVTNCDFYEGSAIQFGRVKETDCDADF